MAPELQQLLERHDVDERQAPSEPRRVSEELGDYSAVADAQLDDVENRDPDAYDVLTVCELIFTHPGRAQSMSSAVQTAHGVVLRLAVPGRHPLKVVWTPTGPRIEAVFPHP